MDWKIVFIKVIIILILLLFIILDLCSLFTQSCSNQGRTKDKRLRFLNMSFSHQYMLFSTTSEHHFFICNYINECIFWK